MIGLNLVPYAALRKVGWSVIFIPFYLLARACQPGIMKYGSDGLAGAEALNRSDQLAGLIV
jgi:hypothetical protein